MQIDDFQKILLNEKITSLDEQLKVTAKKLQILEDKQSERLKIIDQKGVLKDVKNGYAIYHQKKNSYSTIQNKFEEYNKAEKEWNALKLERDNYFKSLDDLIIEAKQNIKNFEDTILDIHEYIMDTRGASFDIKIERKKQILSFEMRIDDDGSHSVDRTKVFIYDLALLFNEFTEKKHPKFLIHDNIFDVDNDTLEKSLNYLAKKETQDFQYILTLNRDKVENQENKIIELDINEHKIANFTKTERFLFGDRYAEL